MCAGKRDLPAAEVEQMYDPDRVRNLGRPRGLPFRIGKLGHVVVNVRDVERSARFYTEVLGFQISDVSSGSLDLHRKDLVLRDSEGRSESPDFEPVRRSLTRPGVRDEDRVRPDRLHDLALPGHPS